MNQTKQKAIFLSRLVCIFLVGISTLLYFPEYESNWMYIPEVLIRTYLLFLCGVMGHEGSHGNLGKTRFANNWWSRFVFIPLLVPNAPFRITHRYHHAFTNIEGKDPDLLLKIDHIGQFPMRALAMPHHWVLWLKNNKLWTSQVRNEYFLSYVFYFVFYGLIANQVGFSRVLIPLICAQALNSFILWYPFAIKTHEGHHTGDQIYRSHNYYGKVLYWLTMGLSMHREHHMHQRKSWLELYPFVKDASLMDQLKMKRDIVSPEKLNAV
jgi:beta-carotene hydroxylase